MQRLELYGFKSFPERAEVAFDTGVTAIVGPNGCGKSNLVDAITWVLWGKARSNSPDDLVHQGARTMQVRLVFEHAGQRYQAIRQRKVGKQGASSLTLHAWDTAGEAWRDQSGARLADTQKKIEALLRLDYDHVHHSAFLMQGRADEFTTKTPALRKQVLATILGLSAWELYAGRAKDHISATRADMHRLEGRLAEIERELARRGEHEQALAAAEGVAQQAAERLAAAESQWAGIQQIRQELVALQRQIDDRTRRITATDRELAEFATWWSIRVIGCLKKVLIAPRWIERVSWEDSKVYVNFSREAIESGPEYRPDAFNRDYEGKLYEHYKRPKYWDAPVV